MSLPIPALKSTRVQRRNLIPAPVVKKINSFGRKYKRRVQFQISLTRLPAELVG